MNVATQALAFALACLVGCTEPKPPPPPTPAPPPPPPAAPTPARVEPKCDTFKEGCKADSDSRAHIPGVRFVFVPPEGWTYAHLEEATVAQIGDQGAVMALTSFVRAGNAATLAKRRAELVTSLTELVLVTPPAGGSYLKADQETDIAGMKMALWERKGAKRGKDSGALLVLSAPQGDRELFGVGFAAKDDNAGTEAILKALQSIAPSHDGDEQKEDGASKDKK